MSGVPNHGSWVRINVLGISTYGSLSLNDGQYIDIPTNSYNTKIDINASRIHLTSHTAEGAVQATNYNNGTGLTWRIQAQNCHASFNYQIYKYY